MEEALRGVAEEYGFEISARHGVFTPESGCTVVVGDVVSVRWRLGVRSVYRIELSRDAGRSWQEIGGGIDSGNHLGIWTWDCVGPPSSTCRIRVADEDGSRSEVSGLFEIKESRGDAVVDGEDRL